MKKRIVGLSLLSAASTSFCATCYWNPSGSDDFALTSNWNTPYLSSASDSLRVGAATTSYANSGSLARLTSAWGSYDSTLNDALVVGGYGYLGKFELNCGSANTAFFRSVIVGDTKLSTSDGDSIMTINGGTLRSGNVVNDTGYITIGRNNTANSVTPGVGYLYINNGTVAMDRMTVGELKAGNLYAGIGHVLLQNDGTINLACVKTFSPTAVVGLKINNGDFTWNDNGTSSITTGALSVNTATLTFQSADNSLGTDGKGIVVNVTGESGNGTAIFSADAVVDVSGLADTSEWVTLVTAAGGITLGDNSLLSPNSIAEGWAYRIFDLDGDTGSAAALQVAIPEPSAACLFAFGALLLLRRKR